MVSHSKSPRNIKLVVSQRTGYVFLVLIEYRLSFGVQTTQFCFANGKNVFWASQKFVFVFCVGAVKATNPRVVYMKSAARTEFTMLVLLNCALDCYIYDVYHSRARAKKK